ncbi:unnamed protein product [Symbiodinium sp. CCMP2456]|nr:unnamed protein product [Symbiodinium sp. CCMP2456]
MLFRGSAATWVLLVILMVGNHVQEFVDAPLAGNGHVGRQGKFARSFGKPTHGAAHSSKCELVLMADMGGVKVGPPSLHSRSCLVLSQTDSGCGSNTKVLSQSRLQLLEDAAMTANIPSKLMVPARPVLFAPRIFGPKICAHVVLLGTFW